MNKVGFALFCTSICLASITLLLVDGFGEWTFVSEDGGWFLYLFGWWPLGGPSTLGVMMAASIALTLPSSPGRAIFESPRAHKNAKTA